MDDVDAVQRRLVELLSRQPGGVIACSVELAGLGAGVQPTVPGIEVHGPDSAAMRVWVEDQETLYYSISTEGYETELQELHYPTHQHILARLATAVAQGRIKVERRLLRGLRREIFIGPPANVFVRAHRSASDGQCS